MSAIATLVLAVLLLFGSASTAAAHESDDGHDTHDTTTTTNDPVSTAVPSDGTTGGQGESPAADDALSTETPNPQPGQPLTTDADGAATTTGDAATTETAATTANEVQGQPPLAFTGPDLRVLTLGLVLVGLGAVFALSGRTRIQTATIDQS